MFSKLPKNVRVQIEKMLAGVIIDIVEKIIQQEPEKRDKAIADLRHQMLTGEVREDALVYIKL